MGSPAPVIRQALVGASAGVSLSRMIYRATLTLTAIICDTLAFCGCAAAGGLISAVRSPRHYLFGTYLLSAVEAFLKEFTTTSMRDCRDASMKMLGHAMMRAPTRRLLLRARDE